MDGSVIVRRNLGTALAVSLLAFAVVSLPPLSLPTRVNQSLYDQWSRLTAPTAPAEILLVDLHDPAWLGALAALSRRHGARLLISTLPQPFVTADDVLGPVAVAVGSSQLLRPTGWLNGGHLWLLPDADGVIRHDRPLLEDTPPILSLGLAAAARLLPEASGETPRLAGDRLVVGHRIFEVDASGRRWLRFYRPHSFTELTPDQLTETPQRLAGALVIAGRGELRHATPVGPLTTRELVAHVVAGYWQDRAIGTGRLPLAFGWILAALLLVGIALLDREHRLWKPAAAAVGLIGISAVSAGAFHWAELWLPAGGPGLLILLAGFASAWRPADRSPATAREPSKLSQARRLTSRGFPLQAWQCYQQVPDQTSLLAELYELGRALKQQGQHGVAEEVFHHVAHLAPDYEGVAEPPAKSSSAPPVRYMSPRERLDGPMPRTLGRYELLEEIGRGAMGAVYLGRDPKINRRVAIKAIDLSTEFDPDELEEASQRFLREAETAGRLNHPNIVTIFDVGESGGLAYIAMEFLQGRHLSEYGAPDSLLPVPLVLELVARAGDALHYAHKQNIVHRDIKPANIMYDSVSDSLKITDFGTARLIDASRTRTGIVVGTPSFMSPEQLEGKNVNGHTDLFALGVTLYQLLTGHLPFRGTSMTKLMFVIANEPHSPLTSVRQDLPECLNAILDKALAKNPTQRFKSGADMAAALRGVVCR